MPLQRTCSSGELEHGGKETAKRTSISKKSTHLEGKEGKPGIRKPRLAHYAKKQTQWRIMGSDLKWQRQTKFMGSVNGEARKRSKKN